MQEDWSGSDGILGPVAEWNNSYHLSEQISAQQSLSLSCYDMGYPYEEHRLDSDFNAPRSLYAVDIDFDGDVDLLGTSLNTVTLWRNLDGLGLTWEKQKVGDVGSPFTVHVNDLDEDGDLDVISASSIGDQIVWWENLDGMGSSWKGASIANSFEDAKQIFSADFDGDGDIDVVGAGAIEDEVAWWENHPFSYPRVWTKHIIRSDFNGAFAVYAVDMDFDGDQDVICSAMNQADIILCTNDGSGENWTISYIDAAFYQPNSVFVSDIDGDGALDVLAASKGGDEIAWWKNSVSDGWQKTVIVENFNYSSSVYSADMDNDGDMDVLGTSVVNDDVVWWENEDALGSSWITHTVDTNFDGAYTVIAADLDNNGLLDVVSGAVYGDILSWWRVSEYNSDGYLDSSVLHVDDNASWQHLSTNTEQPQGTLIGFQVRSSNDINDMGEWSDTLFGEDISLSGILEDSTSLLQYRAILQSNYLNVSPFVEEIYFEYYQLGITQPENLSPFRILNVFPNPFITTLNISFYTPSAEAVKMNVYDLNGRLICESEHSLFQDGQNLLKWNVPEDIPSGCYLVELSAGCESQSFNCVKIR